MDMEKIVKQAESAYALRHRSPIKAPGIVIGAAMVELALDKLGEVKKLGAVAEAKACLSDAIQALTGCTVGNKYLTIHDEIGRYALSLYDRTDGRGIRVFVDVRKIDANQTPEMYLFFHRQRAPEVEYDLKARALSGKKVVDEFIHINHDIFGTEEIIVKNLEKEKYLAVKICLDCGESFTYKDDSQTLCLVCSKQMEYYTKA